MTVCLSPRAEVKRSTLPGIFMPICSDICVVTKTYSSPTATIPKSLILPLGDRHYVIYCNGKVAVFLSTDINGLK